jgi:hypothetical protein
MNTQNEIFEAIEKVRSQGYAVVCFTPEELQEANPKRVEDRLIELSWDVIDTLNGF